MGLTRTGIGASFQLANSAPPLSVTGSAIAPSARMRLLRSQKRQPWGVHEPCGKCGAIGSVDCPRGGIDGAPRPLRIKAGSTALISCRTNLSPFTKDCRVLRASNVQFPNFCAVFTANKFVTLFS